MITDVLISNKLKNLRLQAEAQVQLSGTQNIPELSMDEIRSLIHELETHQIELEMQNDELQNSQDALSELHQRYSDLYDFAPIAYLTTNIKGNIVESNMTFAEMVGENRSSLLGQPLTGFIDRDDQDTFYVQSKKALHSEKTQSCELRLLSAAGDFIWTRMSINSVVGQSHESTQYRLVISDISESKRRECEIMKLSQAVESSSSAIFLTDLDGVIEYVNPSFTNMSGFTEKEAIGEKPNILKSGETPSIVYKELWQTITSGEDWGGEFHNRKKGGSFYWARNAISAVKDKQGEIISYICVQDDVTQEFELTKELSYQASHDLLTGLINRREFERRTENLLAAVQHGHQEHALCYMDLDQFKIINDTSGHLAGDELLRQLGHLLQSTVSKRDTLARLGGDEFGVLMEYCTLNQAYRVASALQQAINDYQFIWKDRTYRIGISIGMVAITQETSDLTELLKEADSACYMAKDSGRNRIHVFQQEDEEIALRQGQMQWVSRINDALDEDRFILYAQPILPLNNNNDKKHYELLIRMVAENGDIITPFNFLPSAERYDLIQKIDSWVIQNAFSLLATHTDFVNDINFISINLSGQTLTSDELLAFIISQMQNSKVDPKKICFEITETVVISNLDAARKFISTLRDLGCRFALDDFGSGLSSFGYLKNLKVDYLKIDGMFVKDMVSDPIDHAMVKSINEIGQVMGMKTIAEFVEDKKIMDKLKVIGVNYAQGYFIDKPKPLIDILEASSPASIKNNK